MHWLCSSVWHGFFLLVVTTHTQYWRDRQTESEEDWGVYRGERGGEEGTALSNTGSGSPGMDVQTCPQVVGRGTMRWCACLG
jgi:hypothetical protein